MTRRLLLAASLGLPGVAQADLNRSLTQGLVSPVSLTYRVDEQIMSPPRYQALELAVIEYGLRKSHPGKLSKTEEADVRRQLADMRAAVSQQGSQRYDVRLSTDGSSVLADESGKSFHELFLMTLDLSLVRRTTGEVLILTHPTAKLAMALPLSGASLGSLVQIKRARPNDRHNPQGAPLLLSALDRGSESGPDVFLPLWPGDPSKTIGTTRMTVGHTRAPWGYLTVGPDVRVTGGTVLSKAERIELQDFRGYGRLGIKVTAKDVFETKRTTSTFVREEKPLPADAFEIEAQLKKGDRVQVDDFPSFFYDPQFGTLRDQIGRSIRQRKLETETAKVKSQGPPKGLWIVAGFAGIVALLVLWRGRRGRRSG